MNEVESFGSLDWYIVDMLVPAEIASDSNTKIRMGVYHIQQGITKSVIYGGWCTFTMNA